MVTHLKGRSRRQTIERNSHSIYLDESLWQRFDQLANLGVIPSVSAAVEQAMQEWIQRAAPFEAEAFEAER